MWRVVKADFYSSNFFYSLRPFFPQDWVSVLFAELVGHQGEHFCNLCLQIAGEGISDTLFDFKAGILHG